MEQNTKLEHSLRLIPLFCTLSNQDVQEVAAQCSVCHIKRGEMLFAAGYPATHVYIVLSGTAKLVRSNPDGKERIVHILMRGEMFGAPVAMQGSFYPVNCIALEQSSIIKIERNIFRDFFLKHPKIGQILIAQMGERIQQAHTDRVLSFDSVEKRIACFLLDTLEQSQKVYGQTSRIPIPLTRQDIADRVASTVETVIRVLSAWSKEKWIGTEDKYIEILKPSELRQIYSID